jgi:cytidine deaminase
MAITTTQASELAVAAREAAGHAYCPYSRFRVGAAVLIDDGRIFRGCNVENASFGLTTCAERNAVCQAVSHSVDRTVIEAVTIYTPTSEPTAPCGACRQVIHEFGPDAEVRCICDGPTELRFRLRELLPAAFGPGDLTATSP